MRKIQIFKDGKIENELNKEDLYSLIQDSVFEIGKKRVGREGKIEFGKFSPIRVFIFGEDSLTSKFLKYMYSFAEAALSLKATTIPCEAMNRYGAVFFDLEECTFDDKKVLKNYWEAHGGISFIRTGMFSFGSFIGMLGDGIYVQLGNSPSDFGLLNF
jgi:hypothetical protein